MEDLPLPPKRKRALSTKWVAVIVIAALAIGYGIGQAPSAASSEPTTVTNEVTPASCLEALDTAEQIFSISAEAMDAAARGFDAASRFDVAGINAAANDITAAGDKLTGITPAWQQARDDCKGAAS